MLGAVPDGAIIVASGLGASKRNAQEQVTVGMGTLAVSAVQVEHIKSTPCVENALVFFNHLEKVQRFSRFLKFSTANLGFRILHYSARILHYSARYSVQFAIVYNFQDHEGRLLTL